MNYLENLFFFLINFFRVSFVSYIPGFILIINYVRYKKTGKLFNIVGRYLYDENNPKEYAESRERIPFVMIRKDAANISLLVGLFFIFLGFIFADLLITLFWIILITSTFLFYLNKKH